MKARVIETNEIVELQEDMNSDYFTKDGLHFKGFELDFNIDQPDYREKLNHRYIGMILAATYSSPMFQKHLKRGLIQKCDTDSKRTCKQTKGERKMIIDEWIVREVIDTLRQANITLLGVTGLDSPQEFAKKCKENETAINRRINNAISLLNSVKEEESSQGKALLYAVGKAEERVRKGTLLEVLNWIEGMYDTDYVAGDIVRMLKNKLKKK